MGDFFDKVFKDIKEIEDNIPEDKDCKKCPYSKDGESLGMMSPCFDFCQGHGICSIDLGEKINKWREEDHKWIREMFDSGLDPTEISRQYRERCEKRRKEEGY